MPQRPTGGGLDEPQRGSIRGSAVSVTSFDDRAMLPSSSVNQSLMNILMCGVIACVFGRRCGGSVTCSGFAKGFGFCNPSDIPLRRPTRVSGYDGCQRYYRAGNPERIGADCS